MPPSSTVGAPRQFAVAAAADLLKNARPSLVVVPAAGGFALAAAALKAGVAPADIIASDTRLLPMLLGHLAMHHRLPVTANPGWFFLEPYLHDPYAACGAVMLAMDILAYQMKPPSLFRDERIRELTERADIYVERGRQSAERLVKRIEGIQFTTRTSRQVVAQFAGREADEAAVALIALPGERPIDRRIEAALRDVFDWPGQAPEEDMELEDVVNVCERRAVVITDTPVLDGEDPAIYMGAPWRAVAAHRPRAAKGAKITWVITNTDDFGKALKRVDVERPIEAKYKLFTEGPITPELDFRVVAEQEKVVAYYRDLLVHRLALVNTERHKVLLLDGKLLACVGAHLQNLRASGVLNGVVKLTFCFTPEHPDYPRLHRLALLAVTSSWFWRDEVSDIEPLPRAIQTTMLTKHPEVKTARGIFTLKDRTQNRHTGEYKLTYYAELKDRTPRETIEEWLRRWGRV